MENEVASGYTELISTEDFTGVLRDDYDKFKDYVHSTYIGSVFSPPLFHIKFWNVHQRVINNQPRTNNAIEAWNR